MKIVLLGATGSIGTSACKCIRRFPGKFQIVGMSTNNNTGKLSQLIREFRPAAICVGDEGRREPPDAGDGTGLANMDLVRRMFRLESEESGR